MGHPTKSTNSRFCDALLVAKGRVARILLAQAALVGGATFWTSADLRAQRCGHETGDSLAVLEVSEGIIAADNARDITRVLAHYSVEAVLMPPGERPVQGRRNIRPRYEALFEQYDPAIVGEIERVEICGDVAVVSGRNGGWLRGRGGRVDRPLSDVYVMLLRLEATGWQITRLIWHADGGGEGGL